VNREEGRGIAAARRLRSAAGRPRQELYLVLGQLRTDDGALARLRTAHLAFLHGLHSRGDLLAAGPLLEEAGTSYEGNGCFLIRSSNYAAALAIARSDPYHRHGVRENRVSSWLISEGDLFDLLAQQPNKG